MVRVNNCAICKSILMLNFEKQLKNDSCAYYMATFHYRLLGNTLLEIDPVYLGHLEAVMNDGTRI
jgi:hypothetical protein